MSELNKSDLISGIQGQVKNEKGEIILSYSLQVDNKPKWKLDSANFFVITTQGYHTVTLEADGKINPYED